MLKRSNKKPIARTQPTPPPDHRRPYLTASAADLARQIRSGEASSREIVEAHIAHIEAVNPRINALVRDRYAEARAEADDVDARVAAGDIEDVGPLFGVPFSVKESFRLTGMPNSSGLVARRYERADSDATAVARWRSAGAIPIGVTNIPELCMWYETHNRVYGRTNNAYSSDHICGGSSGGEGSIVGAGGTPFGIGADVGGSIRMPAFFNGVFGHKPTGGLVPGSGQYPIAHGAALRYLATGPICRSARDLHTLTSLLAGPDGIDEGARGDLELLDPSSVDISGLEVKLVETNGLHDPTPDMRDAMRRAAHALATRGAKVSTIEFSQLPHSFDIWSAMMSKAGGPSFGSMMGQGPEVEVLKELGKLAAGRSEHTLPALLLSGLERVVKLLPAKLDEALAMGEALKQEMVDATGDRGVILFPSFPSVAPRHYEPLLRFNHFSYTAIINVMELPATQVPLGLDERGLPLGVQVVGAHGMDHLCMAVAMELEDLFGGWVPPWEA